LRVADRTPAQSIVATGFPFRHKHLLATYEPAFAAAMRAFEDLRRAGSASLDLCWTAEGVFDGYFELALGPWDVAAGGIIVREAGGVVTDWRGDDRAWLRSGNVLAGPPEVHDVLLAIALSGDSSGT
jgi:myo-inositol-1(or 4)-monophosphatase